MRRIVETVALLAACVLPPSARAQSDALHVEFGGPALLGSINYERLVGSHFSARVGVGALPEFDIGTQLLAPVMANLLLGSGAHRLEAGGGMVLVYAISRGPEEAPTVPGHGFRKVYGAGTLAYRLEPGTGALKGGIYRAGLTPLFFGGQMHTSFSISAGFFTSALR